MQQKSFTIFCYIYHILWFVILLLWLKKERTLSILEEIDNGECAGKALKIDDDIFVIKLEPRLFDRSNESNYLSVGPNILGECWVYDVLIHECIHIACQCLLNVKWEVDHHDSLEWSTEVKRLAVLLQFTDIDSYPNLIHTFPTTYRFNKRKTFYQVNKLPF